MSRSRPINHRWDVAPRDARAIQVRLRDRLILVDDFDEIAVIAGIDTGFPNGGATTRAVVALLEYPSLRLIDVIVHEQPTSFPYVPGLLSFREVPGVLAALERCRPRPDLLLCDGHGRAHPRGFGSACHLGLLADIPAIGVAKSRLVGSWSAVPNVKGRWRGLIFQGARVGAVVRTRVDVKPVFVSSGHRVSLRAAIRMTLDCVSRYRLPDPIRIADHAAGRK